ncbi:hypothetical protein BDB00DRAFT_871855 [Zychaea mexicana]|uniref:uncharacterized protein n=1 Tax=Zychaea mexicana TaxID=64656 RepID=UPI0022FDC76B|nr:uncharacterized protein BDB00DRAFT_871855 [Zychaea mexicana]KAI9494107.1 hypothetical protein BDB00DRAFT_871855 [Zychaea mexicana]
MSITPQARFHHYNAKDERTATAISQATLRFPSHSNPHNCLLGRRRPFHNVQKHLIFQMLAELNLLRTDQEGIFFPSLDHFVQEVFEQCEKALEPLEEEEVTRDDEYVKCIWKAITAFGFFDPDVQPQE